ncbi:MAG: MMPL family transporter, partial [Oscillospiraceae bacterium]|nr:MMPL family transporter [Oscillospiraceae bacterium]
PESLAAVDTIHTELGGYDLSVDTLIGYDDNAMLREEMTTIAIVAGIIIVIVMSLTSRAYMEVPIMLVTFGAAALINMGTNFLFGKISFISDSVGAVLQLALAIDYAVILCHRFTDAHETLDARDAAILALTKAIPEISASSLTTISGLAALAFMKFGIGKDLSMVLIKAILLSLVSVFTLMPGLLVLFCPLIDRTRHDKLLPEVDFLGHFAVKMRKIIPPAFIVLLIISFFVSGNCPYAFSINDLKTAKMTERQVAYFKIKDTFGTSNMVAIVLPRGDYEAEATLAQVLDTLPEVETVVGLSAIEAMDGHTLTEALTPREFSEMVGLDFEVAQMLYGVYAVEHNEYGAVLTGMESYEIPMFDLFIFLKEQLESHNIVLESSDELSLTDMFSQLEAAQMQLQSGKYSRMITYINLPEEGEETYAFLAELREIIGRYYDGDYYLVGNSTNSRDLSDAFITDNLMISLLSAFFVVLVLLFTFQSVGLPLLLILVIQGSIWINFSIPTITHTPLFFLGYLIVSAVQMGANIDYAIVISSHYLELKEHMPHKQAIVHALNAAFPTVLTSGTMLTSAGLLIGYLSAQPSVSTMGICLGRGTFISMLLVLLVLPAFLVLGDSIINRTSFKLKVLEPKARTANGTMRVQGHVRGYISGMVDADFDGILHGQLNASISTEGEITVEGESDDE